jgi:iron complex transport system substrate-binding protein
MKKLLALLHALVMCVSVFASCAKTEEPPVVEEPVITTEEPTAEVPEVPEFYDFTDSAGRVVSLPSEVARIAPSGQLAQMFLIAIAPDLLVSISSEYKGDNAKYVPSNIPSLPVIGQFYGQDNLNLETVAEINPQIIIDIGEAKNSIVEDMDNIQNAVTIPTIFVEAYLDNPEKDTPAEAFRTLGQILGREEKGEELAQFCERIFNQTNEVLASVGDNKLSALYLLGEAGTNVLAKTSYHAEVLDKLTNNLAVVDSPSSKGSGNEVSLEQISLWNPEYIIFAPDVDVAAIEADPTWQALDAIANNHYVQVPQGPYNWMGSPPSINRYLGMIWLTKTFYPEFAVYLLYDQVKEYYELFYGYDLSVADYDALTANAI